MHCPHIRMKSQRPTRWPVCSSLAALRASSIILMLALLLVSGTEAGKPQQQQQQQRSDDSQQQQSNVNSQHQSAASAAYTNHKSPSSLVGSGGVPNSASSSSSSSSSSSASAAAAAAASQSSQPSYSSSVSISGSPSASAAGSQQQPQQVAPSVSQSSGMMSNQAQVSAVMQQQPQAYSNYQSMAGPQQQQQQASMGPKSASYMDSMAASASNPEQSYQAAANSVNLALANSGIFGSSMGGPGGYSSGSSAQQQAGSQQQSGAVQAAAQLNPLHYFYYPAKDTSNSKASNVGQQQSAGQSSLDMMNNAASSNYQSLAYPSYSDQLSSALSGMSSSLEAAASSQDPSYLPQPGASMAASYSGSPDTNGQQSGNQLYGNQAQNGPQQQQAQQVQAQNNQNGYVPQGGPDMQAYASSNQVVGGHQIQPNQPAHNGGISFNGPSNQGMNNNNNNDYMNSHLGASSGHQAQQQGGQQMNGYQASSIYNQLGDLSTSNFGNNAGGLSSVASYMAPNGQEHGASSSQHDLFSAGFPSNQPGGHQQQQFNSAASQLAPSAVSPPAGGQQILNGHSGNSGLGSASSLYNAASSLFGAQQQTNSGSSNNLFPNQHYLNSFLSPQYNQLQGNQQQLGSDSIVSSGSNSIANLASPTAAVSGSSSSKRFGISSFIMPMLALAGLSLLIPTMSNINNAMGRKKRSVDDRTMGRQREQEISYEPMNGGRQGQVAKELSIGEYMDKIERYYSIYKNAVENDDCLNRLICEFGDAVKDVTGKSAVVMVIEKLVPTWMTGKVHLFKEAALDHKEGKEKCKKYICQSNKHH